MQLGIHFFFAPAFGIGTQGGQLFFEARQLVRNRFKLERDLPPF